MRKLLNDGWSFLKLPVGSSYEDACRASGWKKVDLPHDWLIWQENNLYESSDAWYKRNLHIESLQETFMLCFDGVYMDCDILVNGQTVCSHAYGYTAFNVDITNHLIPGGNEIAVHIRHLSPNSRWYSGSGIFRDVYLLELPETHIVPDSFYITGAEKDGQWEVSVSAETAGKDQSLFVYSVLDPSGKEVSQGHCKSESGEIAFSILLSGAQLWDIDQPCLYTLRYSYGSESGEKKFGLRSVCFSPDKGFSLNHRGLKLHGVCLHHDLGALGAAFHEKAARRQLLLMKEMGANALRTSHNPPASKLLDLCDELGILVIDEAFDMWERAKTQYDYARFFPRCEEEDVASWIRRDRCHPCVIMWSIGNEIYDMHADIRGTEVCRMLMEQVRSHDPHENAVVTFGCNYMPWEGGQRCADVVKVAGYNYGEKYYLSHHEKHPDWIIYGSETASLLSSRSIYHFPIEKSIMSDLDLQCSALGNSNTSWGAEDIRRMLIEDKHCSFSMGQFIWSGIDYIGEPTPYHTRSCYFGQADTACFPKDSYYLYQSQWSNRKVLHIGVIWDWNPGQLIDIPVMTNYRRVELVLNGRSLGIRNVNPDSVEECMPVWKIPFEPGELCARALDEDGRILAEDRRITSGNTAGFVLSPDEDTLLSDGHDLSFITVQATDSHGNPVENARDRITVNVSGGAYLMGTDNGDSTDSDGYKQNQRRLFGGKLLLIIASNGVKENASVKIRSSEGIESEIIIPVVDAEMIPGTSCILRIPEVQEEPTDIPVRKIEITALTDPHLTAEQPSCFFRWEKYPSTANGVYISWQITNESGIVSPFAELKEDGDTVTVTAKGDGHFYLRALAGNHPDHPQIISQMEFSASGIGKPALDPYGFISAGLYDLHFGDIGSGNEKGIAFSRDGESMVGFSRVDFGKTGSDKLVLPVFALDGKPYEIMLYDGDPRNGGKLICPLHYEKPSIWNTYQEECYMLPLRLKGLHTLCFCMKEKVHMKGFRFERVSRAFLVQTPGGADTIYGDSFRRDGSAVHDIGNNVSIVFNDMDFGSRGEYGLMIRGRTDLQMNTINIRIRSENGDTETSVANFMGNGPLEQHFSVNVPAGICSVTFVFLPGSRFDFDAFMFSRM